MNSLSDINISDVLAIGQLGPYPSVLGILSSFQISDKVTQPIELLEIQPGLFGHGRNEDMMRGIIHDEFRENRWAVVLAEADDERPILIVDAFSGPFEALNLLDRYIIAWSSSRLNVDPSRPGFFMNVGNAVTPMNNVCVFKSDNDDVWSAANTAEDLSELTTVFDLLELSGDATTSEETTVDES